MVNVKDLYDHLVRDYGYKGYYRSVLRYVRARYPKPRVRRYRHVETPPRGPDRDGLGRSTRGWTSARARSPCTVSVMVLSHSRFPAVVWSRT